MTRWISPFRILAFKVQDGKYVDLLIVLSLFHCDSLPCLFARSVADGFSIFSELGAPSGVFPNRVHVAGENVTGVDGSVMSYGAVKRG